MRSISGTPSDEMAGDAKRRVPIPTIATRSSPMEDQKILAVLNEFEPAEAAYRKLYLANPYDKIPPVRDWQDFVTEYRQNMKSPVEIPTEPISDISTYFYESQFFSPQTLIPHKPSPNAFEMVYPPIANSECVIFKHLRYLPVFDHALEFVKLVYILQGSNIFNLNQKNYRLPAGSLIVVGPNTIQSFSALHDEDIALNIIMRTSSFEKMFLPLLMESNELSDYFWQMLYEKDFSSILLFNCQGNQEIRHLVLQLYYESQLNRNHSLLIINSYVLLLFAQLIRNHIGDVQRLSGENSTSATSRLFQFITENKATVSLGMVAEHFGLSKGYLSRYIKSRTGYTFSGLVQKLRLKEAAYLLINSNLSVEEIVYKVGYTDVSNFYRSFKETYQTTPGEFRSQYS